MKNYIVSIIDKIMRIYHHSSIYIMPRWKLKQILQITPYMEVRYAIWEKLGNKAGKNAYINCNVTLIDDSELKVNVVLGTRTTFSPNVTFITSASPNDSLIKNYRCCKDFIKKGTIYVGDDTWIGAGVIILPGIHIGKRCVVGAGSIVTRDIPDDSLAYGVPCKVIRRLEYDSKS